jgi:NAD(P)-dependent dehydrogenase (short-subunit alcohol dehydrogenase family)
MDLQLAGRHCPITDGSRGIGFATAALAEEGCNLVLVA